MPLADRMAVEGTPYRLEMELMVSPDPTVTVVPPAVDHPADVAAAVRGAALGAAREPVRTGARGSERTLERGSGIAAGAVSLMLPVLTGSAEASAVLKGLEKGFSENRIVSVEHAAARLPITLTIASLDTARLISHPRPLRISPRPDATDRLH